MMRMLTALLVSLCFAATTAAQGPKITDPARADADFAIQGEYSGTIMLEDRSIKVGVQVIALGKGQFRAVAYHGGLPGDGWNPDNAPAHAIDGKMLDNGTVEFSSDGGMGVVRNGKLALSNADRGALGSLEKVDRKSPTLGKEPPVGAAVLFDGSSADAFEGGKLSDDGLLAAGTRSRQVFGDHHVHIEFRLPYQPEHRGQQRGNSGLYLQGRYEVQMLDSFGLEGKNNECGGLYEVKDPDVNMCFPPLAWQTYDIDFTAARYDADGNLTANPRITVYHNGAKIHDNVELPGDRSTRAAPVKPGTDKGPLYLQDHGDPVRYRNIWVQEKQ